MKMTPVQMYHISRMLDRTYIEYHYTQDGKECVKRFGFGATDPKVNTIEAAHSWEFAAMQDESINYLKKSVNTFRDLK